MDSKYKMIELIDAFNQICRKYNLQDLELLDYYQKKKSGVKNVTIYILQKELRIVMKDKINKNYYDKKKVEYDLITDFF